MRVFTEHLEHDEEVGHATTVIKEETTMACDIQVNEKCVVQVRESGVLIKVLGADGWQEAHDIPF